MVDGRVVVGVLGAIGVLRPVALSVRSDRKRRLLAGLSLTPGLDVSVDRLVDVVWGPQPPRTAQHALQVYVSELRSLLGAAGAGLVTSTRGYRLDPRVITTDVHVVEELVGSGRAAAVAGRYDEAAMRFQEALDQWRGEPFDGIEDDDGVRAERARLDALRACVHDELADAYLALGRHAELIPRLQARVVADPLRERAYEQLMTALYRDGRAADALEVYQAARRTLGDLVGLAPGPRLAALEQAVLHHDTTVLEPAAAGPAAAPTDRPFVGRSHEMAALGGAARDAAVVGEVRLVLVGGEPGIGKTRLVDQWTSGLDGWTILRGRCPDDSGVPALWPIGEALRSTSARPAVGAHRSRALAPLLRLLGDVTTEEHALLDATRPESFELHDVVAEYLLEAIERPTVLVVDDAHWADESTLGVLVRLVQRSSSAPLVVVLTHRVARVDRSDAFDDVIGRLVREPRVTRVVLGPLEPDEERAYLRAAGLGLSPQDIDRVRERSEGNPLFLVELAMLVANLGTAEVSLPDSLRHVLDARFTLLGDHADVLASAAVIGQQFDSAVLARLAAAPAEVISQALAAGEEAGLIAPTDATRWQFTHILMAETGVGRLGEDRRRHTHLRIAEVLDEVPIGERVLRILDVARHRLAALPLGNAVDAARACLRAADDRLASFAYEEAAELYGAARRALQHGDPDLELIARSLVGEAEALAAAGLGTRAIDLVDEAIPLIDRTSHPELLALAVRVLVLHRSTAASFGDERLALLLEDAIDGLGDQAGWLGVQLRTDLAMLYYRADTSGRSERVAREAMALAEASGDPIALAFAATGLHQAIWRPDTVHERLRLATTAVATAREVNLAWHESMAAAFRASDAWETGELGKAERDFATATELAGSGRRPRFVWIARSWTALLDLYRGERTAAEAGFAEALAAWGPEPNPDAVQCFFAQQLNTRLLDGDTSDVVDVLREVAATDPNTLMWNALLSYPLVLAGATADAHRALDDVMTAGVDRLPVDVTHHVVLAMLSEAAAALGRSDVSSMVATVLEPFADRRIVTNVYGGGGLCWGSVAHQLGECAVTVGDLDGARTWFVQALAHHRQDDAAPFVERTSQRIRSLGWPVR